MYLNRLEKELEKAEKENQAHQKEVKILQLNKNLLNGYRLTDLTTRTKNRPIWLTMDGSKPTNDGWQTLHESFSQYHHG